MDIKKLASRTIVFLSFVAALITIADHISFRLDQKKITPGTAITVDEPTSIVNDPKESIKEPNERTFIGQLWHDAFSDEGIPVKDRWATRVERYDEVDGVFHRFLFLLFYFPIPGIILLIISSIVAALFVSGIMENKKSGVFDAIGGTIVGFFGALFVLMGLYLLVVWELS